MEYNRCCKPKETVKIMKYTKIPRKLKKKLKKLTLASHSKIYIKYRKLKLKNIRIDYLKDQNGELAWGTRYI